ncbi:unnamed protein product [Polarella glacialis]|uniref:Ion transport domain-containing protein n=1 Tax=Polarella glacialis TaxID=89957 RepID=A0A813LEL2_POLGL|nr:unnamed protein product [Polarella glacialis]
MAAAVTAAMHRRQENAASSEGGSASLTPAKPKASKESVRLPPEGKGIWRWQRKAAILYLDVRIQVAVAGLIAGNFMCNVVEKWIDPRGLKYPEVFAIFETFFNVMFTAELGVNMYAFWLCAFWRSAWNVFDFFVVSIGLLTMFNVPLPGPFSMLRMMRAFRVFRLFKRVKSLNKIMVSLAKAVPGVMNAFFILLLVMSIYAILAVDFFMDYGKGGTFTNERGEIIPLMTPRNQEFGYEYFGNFGKSLYTMFQVLTGESWSEAVARPLLHTNQPIDAIGVCFFFVSFVLVNGVVLINVVVAVLLEKMVDDPNEAKDPEEEEKQEEAEAVTTDDEDRVVEAAIPRQNQPPPAPMIPYVSAGNNQPSSDALSGDDFLAMQADVVALKADLQIIKEKMACILAGVMPTPLSQ